MGGTLEYISGLLSSSHGKNTIRKQFHTVELKVRMDCEGCELKVRKILSRLKGVQSVDINMKQQKVTVSGYMDPKKVLKKAQSTGKKVEIWPYVPYSTVGQPYTAQSYDKKAPAGYVRRDETLGGGFNHGVRQEEKYSDMFSDENPNACSIM